MKIRTEKLILLHNAHVLCSWKSVGLQQPHDLCILRASNACSPRDGSIINAEPPHPPWHLDSLGTCNSKGQVKLKPKPLYFMKKNSYELERKRQLMYRVERKIKFCLSIPGRGTGRKRCCWQLVLHCAKSTLSWQPGRIQLDWDLWIEGELHRMKLKKMGKEYHDKMLPLVVHITSNQWRPHWRMNFTNDNSNFSSCNYLELYIVNL